MRITEKERLIKQYKQMKSSWGKLKPMERAMAKTMMTKMEEKLRKLGSTPDEWIVDLD